MLHSLKNLKDCAIRAIDLTRRANNAPCFDGERPWRLTQLKPPIIPDRHGLVTRHPQIGVLMPRPSA
ncbi:MAG: hypothetical protein PF501_12930 [Salinisphaera sp.]|nr:hypothetical protein [Salinisphaera sp.]